MRHKTCWECWSVLQHLSSMHEAPGLVPSIVEREQRSKEEKEKKRREEGEKEGRELGYGVIAGTLQSIHGESYKSLLFLICHY